MRVRVRGDDNGSRERGRKRKKFEDAVLLASKIKEGTMSQGMQVVSRS